MEVSDLHHLLSSGVRRQRHSHDQSDTGSGVCADVSVTVPSAAAVSWFVDVFLRHYPKTSFTIVTDTPENLRLKQQSLLNSQVSATCRPAARLGRSRFVCVLHGPPPGSAHFEDKQEG